VLVVDLDAAGRLDVTVLGIDNVFEVLAVGGKQKTHPSINFWLCQENTSADLVRGRLEMIASDTLFQ
jgi:hypothetical protein